MKKFFKYWSALKKELSDKYIILFLDFDGTLAPIVDTPRNAFIPQEIKELLRDLSKSSKCKVTIISGRALKDIRKIIGLKRVIYSGNHGLEIEGAGIEFKSRVSPRLKLIIRHIYKDIVGGLSEIKGVLIEDKLLTISVHYRMIEKKDIQEFMRIFNKIVNPYITRGEIKINPGKKVYEIKPPVVWNKGKAVLWLLARQDFFSKKNIVFPIYAGDDVTDEDAFKVLKNKGLTIFVGERGDSEAQYYFKNQKKTAEFLRLIANLTADKI